MQRIELLFFVVGLAFVMLFAAVSSSPAATGKELFAQKCLNCHKNGGSASVIKPVKYASTQWGRFFDKQKHAAVKDISGQLSPSETAEIKAYLMSHAADSDQPEA
jgi:mono/diheme cytochrome c family protein